MGKKGSWAFGVSLAIVVALVIGIFFFFVLYNPRYDSKYVEKFNSGQLVNPVFGLSKEQAIEQFNETFVYYLLYSVKAYNLHNPPLSSDSPKMEIAVDNLVFNAEIVKGDIYVFSGEIANKDIVIKTTREEGVKMLENKNYIQESFVNSGSSIELISGQSILLGKGYLNLYKELTGKSITGSVIRIYID